MPSFRHLAAPLFFALATLSGFSQSAPPVATVGPAGAETLTLSDAIQRALAKNYQIKVSGFGVSLAAAQVTEALGKFDPTINGSYNYSQNTNPLLSIDPLTNIRDTTSDKTDAYNLSLNGLLPTGLTYQLGATRTNYRGTFNAYADNFVSFAGVSATQPLLRNAGFGPTLASIRIAQVNRNISQWQFRQSVIDTITQVIFAYADLNFAYANKRSAVRSRDLAAGLLEENEKRFKLGAMSQYDVTSARSRAASREEGILFAEEGIREAENALKQLIGDDKTPHLLSQHFTIEPLPAAPIVVVDPAADFRVALDHRPDYQQAELNLKVTGINRRVARNQVLPRLDLVGSVGYNGNDSTTAGARRQIQDRDYKSYSWGVVVSVPLTFTTERGRYRAAMLQERQAEASLSGLEQSIVVRVGNAASQIETTQKRIQATRQARELAQATLDAEVKRLRAGQSSTFFVAQQQEIFIDAEVREANAQSDYAKALAEYDRQLGVTLDKLNVKIEPPK